ncbi:MAG: hypothetical protein HY791_01745 [Deltaproteobacteria bacterium]|nr:hypothetical protein [Deltaproteobacteria bacterium]
MSRLGATCWVLACLVACAPAEPRCDGCAQPDAGPEDVISLDGGDECPSPVPGNRAPEFEGLEEALADQDGVTLRWLPARDETPASDMRYRVSSSTTTAEAATTLVELVGDLSHRVTGIEPGIPTRFWVHAIDDLGVADCNQVSRSATVLGEPACVDFDTQIASIFRRRCTGCHEGESAQRSLRLGSYAGVIWGGDSGAAVAACRPADSLLLRKVSEDRPPVGGRMPQAATPLTPFQLELIERWIVEGAKLVCEEVDPCHDSRPPEFDGLELATRTSSTARLCWTAAIDDRTPTTRMVYEIFEAAAPGAQEFQNPRAQTRPGVTCAELHVEARDSRCWVVRAEDLAGNSDENQIERCVEE